MFSSVTSNSIKQTDLRSAIENVRQTRPYEFVRCASYFNIDLQPGYKGNNVLRNSFYFQEAKIDDITLEIGDRFLLYNQIDPVQNGIWNVMSIDSGYITIQRPTEYAKNTPIRPGQFVLVVDGSTIRGVVFRNITREFDENQNKVISYNGTYPQSWEPYVVMIFIKITEIPEDQIPVVIV